MSFETKTLIKEVIGKYNKLVILKETPQGLYLDGSAYGEILLPKKYITPEMKIGESLDVFIYLDGEERIIATTEKPAAIFGEIAPMKVVATQAMGCFVDWGLGKDLFVSFKDQKVPMQVGETHLVLVDFDERTERLKGTTKFHHRISDFAEGLETGDKVDIIVAGKTDLGYKVIVNNQFWGLLYFNAVPYALSVGKKLPAYIASIREDKRIDVSLTDPDPRRKTDDSKQIVLDALAGNGGFLKLGDRSSSEEIYEVLGMSKKTFKKAIGNLYAEKAILISDDGISLVTK